MATQAAQAEMAVKRPGLLSRLDAGSGILPYFLILPTILVILLVAVYPIIDSIALSFLDNPLIASGSTFVGLRNYLTILSDPQFQGSIEITLVFSVVSVFIETILGFGVALLMNQVFPGRGLVRAAILVPWAFPTIVSGQIWLIMYNDQIGIITYILQQLHLLAPGDTLLRLPSTLVVAAIATDVWKTTPFMALLLLAGLQVIPNELYEAASVDGSSRWQQFWTITLPMLKNSLLIALLFRLLDALRVFDLFYIFTGGGRQVQTIASYSYNNMFQGTTTDFAPGLAAAVVLFIICVIVSLIIVPQMGGMLRQE
jgi:ABC-type sugar transport system permease subunit